MYPLQLLSYQLNYPNIDKMYSKWSHMNTSVQESDNSASFTSSSDLAFSNNNLKFPNR